MILQHQYLANLSLRKHSLPRQSCFMLWGGCSSLSSSSGAQRKPKSTDKTKTEPSINSQTKSVSFLNQGKERGSGPSISTHCRRRSCQTDARIRVWEKGCYHKPCLVRQCCPAMSLFCLAMLSLLESHQHGPAATCAHLPMGMLQLAWFRLLCLSVPAAWGHMRRLTLSLWQAAIFFLTSYSAMTWAVLLPQKCACVTASMSCLCALNTVFPLLSGYQLKKPS